MEVRFIRNTTARGTSLKAAYDKNDSTLCFKPFSPKDLKAFEQCHCTAV